MKKIITTVLSAALVAATLTTGAMAASISGAGELSKAHNTGVVQVRGRGGAVAAGAAVGLIGGLAIGSAINNNNNRGYGCDPRYDYCGQPVYARPAYRDRGLVFNDEKGCWVNPNRYWGRCYSY